MIYCIIWWSKKLLKNQNAKNVEKGYKTFTLCKCSGSPFAIFSLLNKNSNLKINRKNWCWTYIKTSIISCLHFPEIQENFTTHWCSSKTKCMFNNPKGGRPILEGRLTLFNMDTNSLFCVKKKDTQTLNCSFLPALRGVNTQFCIGRIVRFSQLINRNLHSRHML